MVYFIDDRGKVAVRFVKKNLSGPTERAHLASSAEDPHPVFDTSQGKFGLLVCWDLAFSEASRELITRGAKIVIVPTFWTLSDYSAEGLAVSPSAEALFLDSILTARCFENTCGNAH